MKVLAVDYGVRRIGVAIGDDRQVVLAKTVVVNNKSSALSILDQLIRGEGIEVIVFGLPLRLDGSAKDEALNVKDFAATISKSTGKPVAFIDERLTSEEAKLLLADKGVPQHDVVHHIDATVARILLEQYYQEQNQKRK